jgi:Flp pilus assembly protein TadD
MDVLLALALSLASIPQPADRAAVATAPQIESLTQQGKPDEAIQKGRAAVAAHPDDVDLRLALARALAAKARRLNRVVNVKMSQEDLDRGRVTIPDAEAGTAQAVVDYDAGLFEEAILHLDFAIKRAPKREDLRVFQCFLLTDAGRIDRAKVAIADALLALPKTPAIAKTMAAYGAERAKRGDPAGGAALLAPVAEAFPEDASVLVDYGNVLTRIGRKAQAFAALDRAIELAPRDVRTARTRAVSAMLLRDYRRAQGSFDATFRLSHGVADEFASYAAAYGIDPQASSALMRELSAPTPSSDPSVADLANAFALAGAKGPSSKEALELGRKLVSSKQYLLAIPVLDRAVQTAPKDTEAATLLGEAYRALGCPQLAK